MADDAPGERQDGVLAFPQSRAPGRNKNTPIKNVGETKLALALDPSGRRARGHGRSRCKGVW